MLEPPLLPQHAWAPVMSQLHNLFHFLLLPSESDLNCDGWGLWTGVWGPEQSWSRLL